MAKHLPDFHSPLMALGKKVLLWFILLPLLVFGVLYGMDAPIIPTKRELAVQDLAKKVKEKHEPLRNQVDELQKRIAADPAAIRLEAELSKLTPEERKKRILQVMREYYEKTHGN